MPPTLTTANLILRAASPNDVERRFRLGPEPDENVRLYGVQPEAVTPFTLETAKAWVHSLIDHPYAWVIDAPSLVGSVRLDRVDTKDRRASFAIGFLRPEHIGRGLGTEAARRVLSFAFDELRLHRVSLRVLAINTRAIRSYEKCGFTIEGRERETVCIDGKWHDDLMMGLLKNELRR